MKNSYKTSIICSDHCHESEEYTSGHKHSIHTHKHTHHEHAHMHAHHHHDLSGKNLFFTILLNILITLSEFLGGIFSGSAALLADAAHNLSDVTIFIVAFISNKISKRPFENDKTFGYKRIEIISAIINIVFINVISLIIIAFAVYKIVIGDHSDPLIIIIIASISIFLNGASAFFIKEDSSHNLNMKYAYIHLLSDMLGSIIVLASGVVIYFTHFYILDSLVSILISFYLIYIGFNIFYTSYNVIMEFAPKDLDLGAVKNDIIALDFVYDIHHIHVWSINENDIRMEMHINFNKDYKLSEASKKVKIVKDLLKSKYHILACGIQAEYGNNLETKLIVNEN
ncbi:MAG: cation diffusion facilitator family transporter [Psittacicella sp.]